MNKLEEVFAEANHLAKIRMKPFRDFLESPQGVVFKQRCSKREPLEEAFVEANRAAKKRMKRFEQILNKQPRKT